MKLVVMTRSSFFVEEDKILSSLFEEGLDRLHLYKPGASPLFSERLLSLLDEVYHRRIMVHEHFYLKDEFGLGGIHIDAADDRVVPKGYRGRISRGCTDLSELGVLKRCSDYVFLRNIFDSIEYKDRGEKSSFMMSDLERASSAGLIDKHVYALGGMRLENVHLAKELGFGGVVICGDLWNRFDIQSERDFTGIMKYFEKLRKAM